MNVKAVKSLKHFRDKKAVYFLQQGGLNKVVPLQRI